MLYIKKEFHQTPGAHDITKGRRKKTKRVLMKRKKGYLGGENGGIIVDRQKGRS